MQSNVWTLVDFITQVSFRDLPPAAVNSAKQCLIDHFAAALYGAQQPWNGWIHEYINEVNAAPLSRIYGHKTLTCPELAAFANGTMAHSFELDDVFKEGTIHTGAVVIPAAMALCEANHLDGQALLRSIILGYEITNRVSMALGLEHNRRGFHNTGTAGAVGAAATGAIVLSMIPGQCLNAIGIATSMASGIKSFIQGDGGMLKRLHPGHASKNGVTAAILAKKGFEAPANSLEGAFGFLEVLSGGSSRPEALSEKLGEKWTITNVSFKPFPSCAVTHSGIQAVLELKQKYQFSANQIKLVQIGGVPRLREQNSNRHPANLMAAQYSIEFCIALAVLGDVRDPWEFNERNWTREDVQAMMNRTEIVDDQEAIKQWPRKMLASVNIYLTDGQVLSHQVIDPPGSPAIPFTDNEMQAKLRLLGKKWLEESRLKELSQTIGALESVKDVFCLTTLLEKQDVSRN